MREMTEDEADIFTDMVYDFMISRGIIETETHPTEALKVTAVFLHGLADEMDKRARRGTN